MKVIKVKSKWVYSSFFSRKVTKYIVNIESNTPLSIQNEQKIIEFFEKLN